jgi:putative DNA primase/helicase
VGRPKPEIARLAGVRLAAACEASEGRRLDAALLKEVSGRDTITARFLYRDEFSFRPSHKLWLATNAAPRMPDADDALWRRIRRVPFERTVPEEKRDPKVKAHLTDPQGGGPAVLAWAVQGCLAWQREGLGYPSLIRQKTVELRASFDPLAEFFAECCVFDPRAETEARTLRNAYETWASEVGTRPIGDRDWGQRLQARGCQKAQRRIRGQKAKVWVGIGLVADDAPSQGKPEPVEPVKANFPQNPLRGEFQTLCPKMPFTGSTGSTLGEADDFRCTVCGAEAACYSIEDGRPLCLEHAREIGMEVGDDGEVVASCPGGLRGPGPPLGG